MAFLKKNWCLMIITTLLFLLVYTIYTSSIPLPDVVNHVDDHITVGFSQIETDNPWRTTQINSFREAFGPVILNLSTMSRKNTPQNGSRKTLQS